MWRRLAGYLLGFLVIGGLVGCEDVTTSTLPGPYVPVPVKGYDGRRLIWEPGPGEAQCYEPSFSPDGTKVVVSYRYGPLARAADLAVLDLNTGELEVIVAGNCAKVPAWSPTGELIAYESETDTAPYIWLCQPDGSAHYRVDVKRSYAPRWGPGGDTIYYGCSVNAREKTYAVYYDLNESEMHVLFRDPKRHVWNPTPSRTGEKIALRLHNPDVKGIDVNLAFVNNEGGGYEAAWPAGEYTVWVSPLEWSPSGRYLLVGYPYPRTGGYQLGFYEVETGLFRNLTNCPSDRFSETITGASWGPDGDIVFGTEEGKLYLIKAPE
jgi:Tol biopolymer transport system component